MLSLREVNTTRTTLHHPLITDRTAIISTFFGAILIQSLLVGILNRLEEKAQCRDL